MSALFRHKFHLHTTFLSQDVIKSGIADNAKAALHGNIGNPQTYHNRSCRSHRNGYRDSYVLLWLEGL